ncbi:Predicted Zn-dependent peptidase [Jatrophihabitans endophyticus]|uniref:Predicted Zn-dependent peptidase n=1 Tax=Jatrophihabitans endophyticus TaxID=1206085 RepID=A0A1M5EQW5_9ACTN|nr:pitrilysin family protein [Jatrophihabitans endophyticus]SHF81693.1 Predicted Zn-dependent peptidase [Jatrophihabitans endophyticus]
MTAPTTVPALTKPRAARALRSAEATLPNGLRVVAVRKPGVPLVELRLRLPFLSARAGHPARATLLSDTLLTGAGELDRIGLAEALQGLGADVSVSVDADRLVVGGNALATNLRPLLEVVASVVQAPAFDTAEVDTERARLVERLTMARARAGVVAAEALSWRMWGDHPYAVDLPQPDDVAAVTPAQLRSLHRSFVRPGGAALVLVGDVTPDRMVGFAQEVLADWTGDAPSTRVRALPTPPGGPLLVVDRPGSVQTSLRMGRAGVTRDDPRFAALQLANLVFGGYFSSRWTENIREDKGYTYGPHSRLEQHTLGATLTLEAEVATEVTAPAMLETWYELGRIATVPVTAAEVESVRQYAVGTLALSTATQAGLASTLSALSAFGLGLDWIKEHAARLQRVTVDEVSAAAAEFFTPAHFTSVVVGDAESISGPLAALGDIERES